MLILGYLEAKIFDFEIQTITKLDTETNSNINPTCQKVGVEIWEEIPPA